MDRRRFLAVSGLAAASPVLAQATGAGDDKAGQAQALFQHVNFTSDGLGLSMREYASLLHEAALSEAFESDYYSRGGLIEQLEKKYAQLLGKEAAMFVPTGTLANHLAVRKLAGNDRRVLVQAESHFFNDSGDCAETLSGLNLVPLAAGRATVSLSEVREWIDRSASGRVETKVGVIAIESPVRRRDHELVDPAELERICRYAREQGIRLHLDGARMFNLPYHTGRSLRDCAALFDTVYVSLWKHFNAASGAILAGSADFIERLFHTRRMFGGALPHAWQDVALVPQYADSYQDDYAKAWQSTDQFIRLLQKNRRFKLRKLPNGTSRFFMAVSGISPDLFAERVLVGNVLIPGAHPGTGEFAMQVNPTIARMPPEMLARVFLRAAEG